MRDKNRIEPFMKELTKIWKEKVPDWRFGQLIENVYGTSKKQIFFMEENETLELFKDYFKEEEISIDDAKKNLEEIIKLSKYEIEKNNESITAILDLQDLKSLKIILDSIESKK